MTNNPLRDLSGPKPADVTQVIVLQKTDRTSWRFRPGPLNVRCELPAFQSVARIQQQPVSSELLDNGIGKSYGISRASEVRSRAVRCLYDAGNSPLQAFSLILHTEV